MPDRFDVLAIESVAMAINHELAKQWDAKPAPGREFDPESWTATGGVIDLSAVAAACLIAYHAWLAEHRFKIVRDAAPGGA